MRIGGNGDICFRPASRSRSSSKYSTYYIKVTRARNAVVHFGLAGSLNICFPIFNFHSSSRIIHQSPSIYDKQDVT